MQDQEDLDVGARITSEGIAKMRSRIGVEVPRQRPFNEYASADAIRHWAEGLSDENPLWCDRLYGEKSRWRSIIASPSFLTTTGTGEVKELPPEVRERGRGALAGVHAFYSGDEWEWFRPVYPGDRLTARGSLYSVDEKKSEFGGISVITRNRTVYLNQRGEVVSVGMTLAVHTERSTAANRGKYFNLERPRYTPETLQPIYDAIDRHPRRNAKKRYWEDVSVGDALDSLVKGPLLVTDEIAFVAGGFRLFTHANEIRHRYMKRHPRALTTNEFGVQDVVERVHWEDEWARRIGNPYAYDYGPQRYGWMVQLVTDWMGDDAWLWKLDDSIRRFNYIGDVTWLKGAITKKYVQDVHDCVDLDIWCEDQREAKTAHGHATVTLPSRVRGAVQLPRPPRELERLSSPHL